MAGMAKNPAQQTRAMIDSTSQFFTDPGGIGVCGPLGGAYGFGDGWPDGGI
jgi:hypothetical protein